MLVSDHSGLKTLGLNVDIRCRGQFTSRFCNHRKHSCPDQRSLCKAHGDPRKTYRVLTSSSSPLEAELERTWEGNLANAGWCRSPGGILDRTWQLRGIPDIPCKNWQVWKLPLLDDLTNHDTRWVPAHSASFSDKNGLRPVLEMKGDANRTALLGLHGGPWSRSVWTQPWFQDIISAMGRCHIMSARRKSTERRPEQKMAWKDGCGTRHL